MAENKLTIALEERDWERIQKLSERNGEPIERLAARLLAADLAKIFNKPPDVPKNSEVIKVYESFVEGRKQVKSTTYNQNSKIEVVNEPSVSVGEPGLNVK